MTQENKKTNPILLFIVSAILFLPLRLFDKIRSANPWLTGFPGPDALTIYSWKDAGIGTSLESEPGLGDFLNMFKNNRALFWEELENKAWRSAFRLMYAVLNFFDKFRK